MDPQHVLETAQDSLSARRVFGEPVSVDGTTVLPVAIVGGGGGGGVKANADAGVGFGVSARPAGVFMISDGDVRWRPAVDVNKIVLGGQIVAIAALVTFATMLNAWWSRAGSRSPLAVRAMRTT